MADVYLHIGLPKTGTTSVQNFLADNREALEKHGICYPDLGYRYPRVGALRNGRFLVASYVDEHGKKDKNRVCAEYEEALDRIAGLGKQFGRIFLTDEAIWHDSLRRPDFWPKLKADLNRRELGLKVIVYLRRQDEFVQSLYRQKVKSSATSLSFRDYLAATSLDEYSLDYLAYLDRLTAVTGRENLILRIYENTLFAGEDRSLFSDFLDIFGLSMNDGFTLRKAVYNISLDGAWLEMRRLLNSLPLSPERKSVLNTSIHRIQYQYQPAQSFQKHTLFSAEDQASFLSAYEKSNRQLALSYLGREDGVLFPRSGHELPEYAADTDDLLQNTLLVCGMAIELLDQKNQELTRQLEELRQCSLLYRLRRKLRHLLGKNAPDAKAAPGAEPFEL